MKWTRSCRPSPAPVCWSGATCSSGSAAWTKPWRLRFNDVDFCLRARALNYSVVMAANVELIHHETLSFGHHYADTRPGSSRRRFDEGALAGGLRG